VFGDTSDDVDEVNCPRFLFVCNQTTNNNLQNNYDYEKPSTFIHDDVAANGGKCTRH